MIKVKKETILEVFALKREKLTNKEIGLRYGHTSGWTQNVLNTGLRLGFIPNGEVHPKQVAKLGSGVASRSVRTMARRAVRLSNEGKSHREISELLGVTVERIGQIIRRGESEGWFISKKYETSRQFVRDVIDIASYVDSIGAIIKLLGVDRRGPVITILKKHGLYESLKERYKASFAYKTKKRDEKYYQRYCDIVKKLGHHPGTKVLRGHDGMLMNWIFERFISIDEFRKFYNINKKDVVYKQAMSTPRRGNKKLFNQIHH